MFTSSKLLVKFLWIAFLNPRGGEVPHLALNSSGYCAAGYSGKGCYDCSKSAAKFGSNEL